MFVHANVVIGVDPVADDVLAVAHGKARCATRPAPFCGYREEEEEVGPGVGVAWLSDCSSEAFLYLALPFFHGCMDGGGGVDVDGLHMEGEGGRLSHGFREVEALGRVVVEVLSKNTVSCYALFSLPSFPPFLSLSCFSLSPLRAFTI